MSRIGVLALQGDVREHIRAIDECGVVGFPVKSREDIASCDGLIIPGGESTTIAKLARNFGLFDPIIDAMHAGLPIYGSCAGMILLADRILDAMPGQETFGGLDMTVRRNAFGRQVDSFESEIEFAASKPFQINAVFIRAPWVEAVGEGVKVLAEVDGHAVAVRSRNLFATSFHLELTNDTRVHRYFIEEIVTPNTLDSGSLISTPRRSEGEAK